MIKEIRNIPLEDFNSIYCQATQYVTSMYNSHELQFVKRHVSIAADMFKGSDNYLVEVLIGDRLLCLIYWRRNEYNTIDLYIAEV